MAFSVVGPLNRCRDSKRCWRMRPRFASMGEEDDSMKTDTLSGAALSLTLNVHGSARGRPEVAG